MKLWQKLSLICCGVLVAVIAACSTLLLLQARSVILAETYRYAKEKEAALASSFSEMAGYYSQNEDLSTTTYSLVKYCFMRFADSASVLQQGEETVYSEVALDPAEYLSFNDDYTQQIYAGDIDGRNILIVGSTVNVKSQNYRVYVVEDITSVYAGIREMLFRFIGIGSGLIAFGTLLSLFFVRRAMRPLERLRGTAREIAQGGYEKRADIRSRDEVGELAADFNAMAEAVETRIGELTEVAQRQRLFIGGVTHEFKTPLTTMLLHADLLENAYMEEDTRQASLSHLQSQCRWLERLTQKLLKLITVEGQIELKKEPVQKLFERAKESTAETLGKRNTPLKTECGGETFKMDIDLMQSLIVNLVDNASKASQAGQEIVLRARGNFIEVEDHGCGIPENELQRVSEPFYMVDRSRGKKKGGTGLGLALVKEIAAAHSVKLHIESAVGKGTTVCIEFPS
ncbi:MAG TPA: ATP-binding protein [Clostridia bacterium]|nr:ATP-binding protein [Clostridia bacterium]